MSSYWLMIWLLWLALMGWTTGKPSAPSGNSPTTVNSTMGMNEGPDPFGI